MIRGRFAPSPTGRMHLGNVYSALLSWLSARSQGGEWVLRIEDIDPQRSRPEYTEMIKDDLLWLGLDWDALYVQSERYDLYEQHLQRLTDMGITYPCYCTRADIMATQAPHESDGRVVYKGTCRQTSIDSALGEFERGLRKPSTRIIVPDQDITFQDVHYGKHTVNLARHCGDFILRRADGAWAYQLAVVVDDALMEITEVVRGCDLLLSAPQQIFMHRLLGYEPPAFCHLPLLCNKAGQRLSKRDKSLDMESLRSRYSAQQIIGKLAHLAGIIPEPTPIEARNLIPLFSWDKVPVENITLNA